MRTEMSREFRNHGAHRGERPRHIDVTFRSGELDVALRHFDAVQTRAEYSFGVGDGTLDLETLGFLAEDGEAFGLQQESGACDIRGIRSELLLELRRGEPVVVARRGRVGLRLHE